MTSLVLMLLAAQPVGGTAAPPSGAPPPAEQPTKAPLPSAFAAHGPRIDADLRALNDPTLTRGEAVRAALDLRSESQQLRAALPGAPDEVRRAAMAVEQAAGDVVTAASQGDARTLDRATSRFGTAWSSLRVMEPAPQPAQP